MIKIIFYSQVHSLFSPGTETVVMTGRHIQSTLTKSNKDLSLWFE